MIKKPHKPNWHPPLDPEDVALWEDVKKTIKRLPKSALKKDKLNVEKLRKEKSEAIKPKLEKKALEKKPVAKVIMPPPSSNAFDRTTLRRIKSGRMDIDDTLDLHGMRQIAAHHALEQFISRSQRRGCKLVLVITGKGDRFSKAEGVLRQQLPRWLAETNLSRAILSFTKASVAHGGEGAFYIRLRKKS